MNRTSMILILCVSVLICAWDVYAAVRGHGNNYVAWALGAMMAVFSIWLLTKIVRGDSSL
jgi:hypothetical protein